MQNFTDAEIYSKMRNGVPADVLAELYACKVRDIEDAQNRHAAKIQQDDKVYTSTLFKSIGHGTHSIKNLLPKEGSSMRHRYTFTDDVLAEITRRVQAGEDYNQIFNSMFSFTSDRPSVKSLYVRVKRIEDELRNAESVRLVTRSVRLADLEEVDNEVQHLSKELNQFVTSFSSKLDALSNKLNDIMDD